MSWRIKDNLGSIVVSKVHDLLRVQDQWLVDCGRGFQYWPADFAVLVSSDAPNFHNAYSIFRLHSEIEIARGDAPTPELELAIARQMGHSALSALTYDADTCMYKTHCSAYAQCDNEEWLSKVFLAAVILQIGRASSWAKFLSEVGGMEPVRSIHPIAGARKPADPLVNAVEQFVVPMGKQPSKWSSSNEWEDAFMVVKRMSRHCDTDGQTYIRADLPWTAGLPIVLEATTLQPHAQMGNGLLLKLTVPWDEDEDKRGHSAMMLNDLERVAWNWCHDIGAWCLDGKDLVFSCFIPNICYHEGALRDMIHDMVLRARWVNETAALEILGVRQLLM